MRTLTGNTNPGRVIGITEEETKLSVGFLKRMVGRETNLTGSTDKIRVIKGAMELVRLITTM